MANRSFLASLMFLLAILLISSSDYGYVVAQFDVTGMMAQPAEQVAEAMAQPYEHAAEKATEDMEDKAAAFAKSAGAQALDNSLGWGAWNARKFGEGVKADLQNANNNGLPPGSLKSAFNNAKNMAAGLNSGNLLGGSIPTTDNMNAAAPNAEAPTAAAPGPADMNSAASNQQQTGSGSSQDLTQSP